MTEKQDERLTAVLTSTSSERTVAGEVLLVCFVLVVGLPLLAIGAGVAVVLFRWITGL